MHSELAHVPWRPNSKIQIPTYSVIWDELSGRNLPPTHAHWNAPSECNTAPHDMLQHLLQRHQIAAQALFPSRIIKTILQPILEKDNLVILEGLALRIDVEQQVGVRNTIL